MENAARIGSARNLARNLLKKAQCDTAPILIKNLLPTIKQDYPIKIQGWDFGDNVSGVLMIEESVIGYNELQHVHRQRFSVAHEIGHLLMGHSSSQCSKRYGKDKDPIETEADQFATELLMPLQLIKKDVVEHKGNIETLALLYWVSKEAMTWRVQDPHVLKELMK